MIRLAENVGREEHQGRECHQEHAQPEDILDRVVGMERNLVLGPLGVDADRVAGAEAVQRPEVKEDHADDQETGIR